MATVYTQTVATDGCLKGWKVSIFQNAWRKRGKRGKAEIACVGKEWETVREQRSGYGGTASTATLRWGATPGRGERGGEGGGAA